MIRHIIPAVLICLLLLAAGCKSEQKSSVTATNNKTTKAPAPAPATHPIASNSITHFWFETDSDTPPGRREWVKNADQWEERYTDGHITKFKIVGMVKEGQYQRPHLVRIADDKFDDQLEVLLPPPVEGAHFEFRRPGETEWHQYQQIHLFPATTRPAK